ncbi:hypothetical protein ABW19_dt0205989 [Dactylella cylindrospora]|nr:hypothetical protein ABW19_dt0205989 [Dactylella cylindrospora]
MLFLAEFVDPPGLHPKLNVTVAPIPISPAEECTINAYFTIPQPFFVDPYQLQDEKLMKSYGIKRVRVVEGETDLEAPTWAVSKWGATVIAELDWRNYFRGRSSSNEPLKFTFPLHLRYMPTDPDTTSRNASLPWPSLFWACKSEEWSKMKTNPFDRTALGYEEYFPEQSYFYHLTPKLINTTLSQSTLEVPILSSQSSQAIYWGTVGVIAVGFLWVFGSILSSLLGLKGKETKEHKKKE